MINRCEECLNINTVGKVVTCRMYDREIPDVTKIPLYCKVYRNEVLEDEHY